MTGFNRAGLWPCRVVAVSGGGKSCCLSDRALTFAHPLTSRPVREVAKFGSAYFGIIKRLHDQLEEAIQLKENELVVEEGGY